MAAHPSNRRNAASRFPSLISTVLWAALGIAGASAGPAKKWEVVTHAQVYGSGGSSSSSDSGNHKLNGWRNARTIQAEFVPTASGSSYFSTSSSSHNLNSHHSSSRIVAPPPPPAHVSQPAYTTLTHNPNTVTFWHHAQLNEAKLAPPPPPPPPPPPLHSLPQPQITYSYAPPVPPSQPAVHSNTYSTATHHHHHYVPPPAPVLPPPPPPPISYAYAPAPAPFEVQHTPPRQTQITVEIERFRQPASAIAQQIVVEHPPPATYHYNTYAAPPLPPPPSAALYGDAMPIRPPLNRAFIRSPPLPAPLQTSPPAADAEPNPAVQSSPTEAPPPAEGQKPAGAEQPTPPEPQDDDEAPRAPPGRGAGAFLMAHPQYFASAVPFYMASGATDDDDSK